MIRIVPAALATCLAIPTLAVVGAGLVALGQADPALWRHLADHLLPRYVPTTLILTVAVVAVAAAIGCACAWVISHHDFPGRRTLAWALVLPFAVPSYLSAYAYVDLLQASGPVVQGLSREWGEGVVTWARLFNVRTMPVAVAVMAAALYPYVYLACLAALKRQPPHLYDAARTLGSSPWRVVREVGLPLLRPAVAAGALLVALEVLNDFGTVDHFAIDTMATGLYRIWFGYGDRTTASQFAFFFLVLVVAVVATERLLRGRTRFWATRTASLAPRRLRLVGGRGVLAMLLCLLPVAVGFVIPAAILAWHATTIDVASELARTWPMIGRTVAVAASVSVLAVAAAAALTARSTKWSTPGPMDRAARVVATLGYAIPGGLLAVGVLSTVSFGSLALGFLPLLVYGQVVRFVAIPTQSLDAAHAQLTPTMGMAARTLGAGPWRAFFQVHLRLLTPAALGAGLLVFIDSVKELPVAMILRPLDFDLLSIRVHNMASDERLDAASVGATLMILISLPPVFWLYGRVAKETA